MKLCEERQGSRPPSLVSALGVHLQTGGVDGPATWDSLHIVLHAVARPAGDNVHVPTFIV
jgi:hypothetical protein